MPFSKLMVEMDKEEDGTKCRSIFMYDGRICSGSSTDLMKMKKGRNSSSKTCEKQRGTSVDYDESCK